MKSVRYLLAIVIMAIFLSACSVSTEQVAADVRASIERKFSGKGMTIKNFTLTKKTESEYVGILETQEPNGSFTYKVQVISDGKTHNWQIVN